MTEKNTKQDNKKTAEIPSFVIEESEAIFIERLQAAIDDGVRAIGSLRITHLFEESQAMADFQNAQKELDVALKQALKKLGLNPEDKWNYDIPKRTFSRK
jgi:hypothetical protein